MMTLAEERALADRLEATLAKVTPVMTDERRKEILKELAAIQDEMAVDGRFGVTR